MVFVPGQRVYALVEEQGWIVGTVLNRTRYHYEVKFSEGERPLIILEKNMHLYMPNAFDIKKADLYQVDDLHEAVVLHCLRGRFETLKEQYSNMGPIVISINPFALMTYNSEKAMKSYLSKPDTNRPHIWGTISEAFTQLVVRKQGDQSIVISGESGSGKTENCKTLMTFLGKLSLKYSANTMQRSIVDRMNEMLDCSNPVLESFGNARTVRNDNSSRFGKYTKLFIDPRSGIMTGGEVTVYLLERSRVTGVNEGERSYHIFYEMLAGLTDSERTRLRLKTAKDYPSLAAGGLITRRGVTGATLNDAEEFQTVVKAMKMLGYSEEQQKAIWEILAAILHLLAVKFEVDEVDKARILSKDDVAFACSLLQVDVKSVEQCLLVKSRNKFLTSLNSKAEAEAQRESFCKALYCGLFDHIVQRLNNVIVPSTGNKTGGYIGLLDIFGFENFKLNSFEQLCINYTNESLQGHYNTYTFVNDEAECREEGIPIPKVEFPDNAKCLQLFTEPRGIFNMLDEQCYLPGGSEKKYTESMWEQQHGKNPHFSAPKHIQPTEFTVHHYAAPVIYNTIGWLPKNSDPLKEFARDAVQKSANDLIRDLLDNTDVTPSDGQNRKRISVGTKFCHQLKALLEELHATESHFIRCLKPNVTAVPGICETGYMHAQLESNAVLQTVQSKRKGYPVRRLHQAFVTFFHSIGPHEKLQPFIRDGKWKEAAEIILELFSRIFCWDKQPEPSYAIGKTKVFLRAHVWGVMERALLRRNSARLALIHKPLREWMQRWKEAKEERLRKEREAALAAARALAEKKAAEERARKEAEKARRQKAKEEARRRRRAPVVVSPSPNEPDPVSRALNAKMPNSEFTVFEEACIQFQSLHPAIIMDVVGQVSDQKQAFMFMREMSAQEQDFTSFLPSSFVQFMHSVDVREGCIRNLVAKGVDSIQALHMLTVDDLSEAGFNEEETQRTVNAIIQQESHLLQREQLVATGTGAVDLGAFSPLTGLTPNAVAVRSIISVIGCDEHTAHIAYNRTHNVEAAIGMILDGTIAALL